MQKLHLVGFTTDQQGLILSARRGARSGSFHLPLDEALADAVEELRERQAAEAEAAEELDDAPDPRASRVESALPVREIQARLRQGRAVHEVAVAAGVDDAWVERFATPVFAEQARVVAQLRGLALHRPRLGPSTLPIGEAVRANLADRGVVLSPEELATAWSARQRTDGRWTVRCAFRSRNKDQVLTFELDDDLSAASAGDRLSGQLGYVAPAERPPPPGRTEPDGDLRSGARRASVNRGFRAEPAAEPVSRPARERERAAQAMVKAAAKGVVEAERGAARKAKEREAAAVRADKAAQAEVARRARERKAAQQARAVAARQKEAAAKRAAAERAKRKAERQAAAQAARAEKALLAAERAAAPARQRPPRPSAAATAPPAGRARKAPPPVAEPASPARAAPTPSRAAKTPARRPAPVAQPAPPPPARTNPRARPPAVHVPRPTGSPNGQPAPVAPLDGRVPPRVPVAVREEVRPRFRPGTAEVVEPEVPFGSDPPGERPAANGTGGLPLGRPRRTRPLRAT